MSDKVSTLKRWGFEVDRARCVNELFKIAKKGGS